MNSLNLTTSLCLSMLLGLNWFKLNRYVAFLEDRPNWRSLLERRSSKRRNTVQLTEKTPLDNSSPFMSKPSAYRTGKEEMEFVKRTHKDADPTTHVAALLNVPYGFYVKFSDWIMINITTMGFFCQKSTHLKLIEQLFDTLALKYQGAENRSHSCQIHDGISWSGHQTC